MTQNPADRKCLSDEPERAAWMGETDLDLDEFSFTWTIRNYSFLCDLAKLKSPLFRGGSKTKNSWKLLFRPKNKFGSVEYVSCHLELYEDQDPLNEYRETPVKAHFQISILNADGQPVISAFDKKKIYEFTKTGNSCGQPKVITSADLVDPTRRLLLNDTLKIFCQVWIHGDIQEKVGTYKFKPSGQQMIKLCRDRFANDFGRMFSQSIATDVIVSTEKTSFKAHKSILAARSSVFAAMFNADMMERETATVQIADFDKEVVKGMLDHLYTGETTVMADRAQELLQIAEKYNLEGLKEDCEYSIADNLSKDNVVEILMLANSHNAAILKSHAISFINWNKEELMKMKSFQDTVDASACTGLLDDLCLGAKK